MFQIEGNDDIYLYDIKTNNLKKISNSDGKESLQNFHLMELILHIYLIKKDFKSLLLQY